MSARGVSDCISVLFCSSFFNGWCLLNLAMGDDFIRVATGSHCHGFHGFRDVFTLFSTSKLTVFAWPAAVSVEWVHLVRSGDRGRRCSKGRTQRKWGIKSLLPCLPNNVLVETTF